MVASGAAGLLFGSPLKDAACGAHSIFKLSSGNKNLKKNIQLSLVHQIFFAEAMKSAHGMNEQKIVLIGSEKPKTQ